MVPTTACVGNVGADGATISRISTRQGALMATLGLKDEKKSKKDAKSSSQADEASDILKKMEEKKDAGDCPFC